MAMRRSVRAWRDRRVHDAMLADPEVDETLIHPPVGSRAHSTVASHWVVYVPRIAEALGGLFFLYVFLNSGPASAWLPLLIGFGLLAHAAYSSLVLFMDVMVLTNVRVFRVTGMPVSKRASMPLSRILDVTVERPLLGAILDYGHFTFESAAQTQGMKDVKYVPHPFEYEKMILQHVHTSSGKRS
jgi:PH (Pleckstrin Homology) domain-containing protein